jgi:hypothetical protein
MQPLVGVMFCVQTHLLLTTVRLLLQVKQVSGDAHVVQLRTRQL